MAKLNPTQVSFLCRLYNEQPLSIDKLPYSTEFNRIVKHFRSTFGTANTRVIWNTLINLRKDKKLMRKSKSTG